MIVVSDITPLISLLKINQLDLLEKLFGEVLIPVKPVDNLESVSILKRATGLDQGESEAIVLTDELRECVDGFQRAGRHIGQRHYQMLLGRLKD